MEFSDLFYQFTIGVVVTAPCLENIERHIQALREQGALLGVNEYAPLDFIEMDTDSNGRTKWAIEVGLVTERAAPDAPRTDEGQLEADSDDRHVPGSNEPRPSVEIERPTQ